MLVGEAIDQIDALEPNQYSKEEKTRWLHQLDGRIAAEIVLNYEHDSYVKAENGNIIDLGKPFASGKYPEELYFYVDYAIFPYGEKSGIDSYPLAAIAPFDRMYVLWLKAQIQFANAEYGRYNNTISVFESEFAAYRNWYNRSHTPLNTSMTYF